MKRRKQRAGLDDKRSTSDLLDSFGNAQSMTGFDFEGPEGNVYRAGALVWLATLVMWLIVCVGIRQAYAERSAYPM